MTVGEVIEARPSVSSGVLERGTWAAHRGSQDLQRTFRLLLATVWLLDAALQLQPNMFMSGSGGLSGMLNGVASGNPGFVSRTVTWNASDVYHHPILSNAVFASIQFVIAIGIVYGRTCKPAIVLSVVWATCVWWFGEGAGLIFRGGATPFGGGPGGVLFYAVLGIMLWPSEGSDRPFVAARTLKLGVSKAVWAVLWCLLAVLSLVGSGRSPHALHDLVSGLDNESEPGWISRLDLTSESLFRHHGASMAIALAAVCVVGAAGVFAPPRVARASLILVVVVFAIIWVAVQNLGGILAGGATDPNSGPLVILLAFIYWPLAAPREISGEITRALSDQAGEV